jgi:CheY-like chemotaxis protein
MRPDAETLLWCLRGHGRNVLCMSRRTAGGLELRVLWGDELFLTETFRDPDHLERRSEEFRATLQARGWKPLAGEERTATMPPPKPLVPAGGNVAPRPVGGNLATPNSRQSTVLIVDDEVQLRSFLRQYLQQARYSVTEAGDVDQALNVLDKGSVDAVVLDVRLPDPMGWGRTGLEVLAFIRLHNTFSHLPVLILTGRSLEPEEHEVIERHHADLFLKPDGYRMLLQRLDHVTGRDSLQQ